MILPPAALLAVEDGEEVSSIFRCLKGNLIEFDITTIAINVL